jgi:hypothetical protein
MSYVSILKNIPEVFSQPTGIAAIASVGIHGAIALIVPLMPVDSSKPKDESASRSVGVLELSQVDQNRLPQTPGAPQVGVQQQLPKFPNQQQLALQPQIPSPSLYSPGLVAPPLPPTPSGYYTQPVLPPVPTTANNYRISSLPTRQSLQLPKQNFRFDNSDLKANSQRFTSVVPNFESKPVIPQTQQPLPVKQLPDLPSANIPPDLANSPIPNTAASSSITTANNIINPQARQFDNNIPGNQNLTSPSNIAVNPQTGNNTTSTTSIRKFQPINTPNLPIRTTDQTQIAQLESYAELRKSLQQQYPNSEEKAVVRDTVPVSKAGVEGTVLGFLVVDQEGKVLDLKFQDKMLSPALKLKSIQYLKGKSWKGDNQISRYPFSLRFQDSTKTAGVNPGITPSLEPTPQFSQPVNNSTQPTPTPLATAKPLPLFTPASNNIKPTPTPSVTIKPSSTETERNQLSSSKKPNQSLIQTLRQVRERREGSNSEK